MAQDAPQKEVVAMPSKVKAAVLNEFGRLDIEEFPYPEQLEPGAMVVSMMLAGI